MKREKRNMPTRDGVHAARESIRAIWPKEVEGKLDDMLALRIRGQFRIAEEAVRLKKPVSEPEKIRTIIHLRKGMEFEEERRLGERLPRDERVKVAKQRAKLVGRRQAPIINSIKRMGGSVVSRIRLTNSIVVDLTPEQIKQLALEHQAEIHRIESDKKIGPELDVSAPAVTVDTGRLRHNVSGRGIIVAVIGGEVDANHRDLRGRVVHKRNYTDEPWGNPDDHGTLVAGIIAGDGTASGGRYVGMAPSATIFNYKIWSSESFESVGAKAISDAVDDGVDVINCSWGIKPEWFGLWWPTPRDGTCEVCKAANEAWGEGVVVVKSCGNEGPGSQTTTCPANALNIISVGVLNKPYSRLGDSSSRGPTADGRPKPELVAPGEYITGCKAQKGVYTHGGYMSNSGTSFAAPHVTGIVALLLEKFPDASPGLIRSALCQTAVDLGYDTNEEGSGRVDSLASLELEPMFYAKRYYLSVGTIPTWEGSVAAYRGRECVVSQPYHRAVLVDGDQVEITVRPHSGSYFSSWRGVGDPDRWHGSTAAESGEMISDRSLNLTLTMDRHWSVYAVLQDHPKLFSVNMRIEGVGSTSPGSGAYEGYKTLTIKAEPGSGRRLDHWGGDASGDSPVITITMDGDKEITAYFEKAVNLTIVMDGHGTIDPASGIHTCSKGAPLTITTSPAAGWKFDHWGGDASGDSPTITITMDGNKEITAHFASTVHVTNIFYDGLVPRTESDEYVEIKNFGDEPQDLTGWVLKDAAEGYPSFTFPHYVLELGATIRVYTNEIHPEWGGFSFGYGRAIWNNKMPDTAALYNAEGQEVSEGSYKV